MKSLDENKRLYSAARNLIRSFFFSLLHRLMVRKFCQNGSRVSKTFNDTSCRARSFKVTVKCVKLFLFSISIDMSSQTSYTLPPFQRTANNKKKKLLQLSAYQWVAFGVRFKCSWRACRCIGMIHNLLIHEKKLFVAVRLDAVVYALYMPTFRLYLLRSWGWRSFFFIFLCLHID